MENRTHSSTLKQVTQDRIDRNPVGCRCEILRVHLSNYEHSTQSIKYALEIYIYIYITSLRHSTDVRLRECINVNPERSTIDLRWMWKRLTSHYKKCYNSGTNANILCGLVLSSYSPWDLSLNSPELGGRYYLLKGRLFALRKHQRQHFISRGDLLRALIERLLH